MKTLRVVLALLFALALPVSALAIGPVVGAGCQFQWTEPQTNTDGSNLADLMEYRIYVSTTPGTYAATPSKVVPAPLPDPALSATVTTPCPTGMTQGQKYAVVEAVDLGGNRSARSNEAPFVFDTVGPAAPTQLVPLK